LHEREVVKKQKIFIRWLELSYSYNKWFGNHSLKAAFTLSKNPGKNGLIGKNDHVLIVVA
jgi:hypothetical protein